MTGQLASFDMTAKPIASIFEPPTIGMPNPYSGGGSTFSGIEGLLMDYAMSDAMGSAQQNAKQKVSNVMSGIKSLVSEAFPNFSMGTGSGTVGGGNFNPTPSPVPFADPPAIPSTPMQPPMMGGESIGDKLFGTKMTDIVGSFGSEVTTPAFTGPNSQNTYVGGVLVNPVTATANPTPKVPSFMDESGGAIDFSIVDNPIQKQVEDPLINLAYNFNMENSPF